MSYLWQRFREAAWLSDTRNEHYYRHVLEEGLCPILARHVTSHVDKTRTLLEQHCIAHRIRFSAFFRQISFELAD